MSIKQRLTRLERRTHKDGKCPYCGEPKELKFAVVIIGEEPPTVTPCPHCGFKQGQFLLHVHPDTGDSDATQDQMT